MHIFLGCSFPRNEKISLQDQWSRFHHTVTTTECTRCKFYSVNINYCILGQQSSKWITMLRKLQMNYHEFMNGFKFQHNQYKIKILSKLIKIFKFKTLNTKQYFIICSKQLQGVDNNMKPNPHLIWFTAPRVPMIIIIINWAPIIPRDWTSAAAAAILFGRAPVIPILRAISIIYRASALSPWTATVLWSIGLPPVPWGRATLILWTSFIRCWATLPTFRWWWWISATLRAPAVSGAPCSSLKTFNTPISLDRWSWSAKKLQIYRMNKQ